MTRTQISTYGRRRGIMIIVCSSFRTLFGMVEAKYITDDQVCQPVLLKGGRFSLGTK